MFTAVNDSGSSSHQVRRVSEKEYYNMTGSLKRAKQLHKEKDRHGITPLENQLDSCKTASSAKHHNFVRCFLQHFQALATFYGPHMAELRFRNYQGKQRAGEEMVNILVNGGEKYSKRRRKKTKRNRKKKKKKQKAKRKKVRYKSR